MGFQNNSTPEQVSANSGLAKLLRANMIKQLAYQIGMTLIDSGANFKDIESTLVEQANIYGLTGEEFDFFCNIIHEGFKERDNKVSAIVN